MRAVLALALSALALFPAAAAATDPQPAIGPFDSATVTKALDVAATLWSPNQCAGRTYVTPVTEQVAAEAYKTTNAYAFAWPLSDRHPDCQVFMVIEPTSRVSAAGLCSIMAHEIGHLLGNEHTPDDPAYIGQIMFPAYTADQPPCTAAFPSPSQSAPPASPPDAGTDDTLDDHFVPYAATPHLMAVQSKSRHRVALALNNPNALGRVVVTFYRRGFVLGCGGGVCNPWDLGGRIARRSAPLTGSTWPTVSAPRRWTIATVQIKEPGTRAGVVAAFTPDRVKRDLPPRAGCEFPPCA